MSGGHERWREAGEAIFADEIGLEYGVYGDYRLRSACQPIYACRDGLLVPAAVHALIQPHRGGRPVSIEAFHRDVPVEDRPLVENLSRTLHLHNYPYVDLDGAALFFNCDPLVNDRRPARALAEISSMARHLGDYRLDASMLVCEIGAAAGPDDALDAAVRAMRHNGFRIAVGDFGVDYTIEARIRRLEPDIVKIDGSWFGELCRHAAAERLFRPLLSLLHDQGVEVLVEGIEAPSQLRVALEAGADLFQGPLLAKPLLTGTLLCAEPLAIDDLIRPPAKIIPLFG